jgi:hypothetical protein
MTEGKLCLELVTDDDLASILGQTELVQSERPDELEAPALPALLEKMEQGEMELPELDQASVNLICERLSAVRYPQLEEVLKILSPKVALQIAEMRNTMPGFLDIGRLFIRPTLLPPENNPNEQHADQLILAMFKLQNADYSDLEGFAIAVIPDFKERIARLGARNLKIIPRMTQHAFMKKWVGFLHLQYQMDKPVSDTELGVLMESSCCQPMNERAMDILLKSDYKRIHSPVATPLIFEQDHPEGNPKWYIYMTKGLEPGVDLMGETMPVGMNFIAVCERKFFAPLEAPLEK